jgi:hypothetical protein
VTEIHPRSTWKARTPRRRFLMHLPSPRVWVHHSAGASLTGAKNEWWASLRQIQRFHMDDRGWDDIAYSFLIGGGEIFEGRGAGVVGGHTSGNNSSSHGICLLGNYEFMHPTDADLAALARLLAHGRRQGWWGELTGDHSQAPGARTACAGKNLRARLADVRRDAGLITDVIHPKPTPPKQTKPAPEHRGDDVIYHIKDTPYTFLSTPTGYLALTEAAFWDLAGQGVKVVHVSNDFFQANKPKNGQGSLVFGARYPK